MVQPDIAHKRIIPLLIQIQLSVTSTDPSELAIARGRGSWKGIPKTMIRLAVSIHVRRLHERPVIGVKEQQAAATDTDEDTDITTAPTHR